MTTFPLFAVYASELHPTWSAAEPPGHQDQISQRLRRHLVHQMAAMLPYGFFGDAKLDRDSFLQKAGSDKREHFAFARGRASGSIPLPESQTSTLMQLESSANADSVTSRKFSSASKAFRSRLIIASCI